MLARSCRPTFGAAPVVVYCDVTTAGGGWTLATSSRPTSRQLLGFNSFTRYGCQFDPGNSDGMVVWYGDGYSPDAFIDPARPGSFGLWLR